MMENAQINSSKVSSASRVEAVASNTRKNESSKTLSSSQNAQSKEEITSQKLRQTTDDLNSQMEMLKTNVRFAFSDDINALFVQVTEKDTGRVIRQIPSEEAIKIASYFKNAVGLLFDKEE